MKKFFTLIAVAVMAMGVNAQTTIFSWEAGTVTLPEGSTTLEVTGGTITANGTNNPVTETLITVSAKKADIAENNVTITLNKALAEGDVISITGYRKKDNDANGNLYIAFEQGTAIDEGSDVKWNNIHEAVGQEPNTNTYTVSDQGGSKIIQLARSKASTNVFITKIEITRGGGAVGGVETWSATDLTFVEKEINGKSVMVLQGTEITDNPCSYSIPEESYVFPEGTKQDNFAAVLEWLDKQANPSTYATPLKEYTFKASTASVSLKAVSTPNNDKTEDQAWRNLGGEESNTALNTDECPIKWTNYVQPNTGNPSLGYYDYYEAKSDGGTVYRVDELPWSVGCGKAPVKGTYYEFTFSKAGSMTMGVNMSRPQKVVVVDKETLTPLAYTDMSFKGFVQNNTFKYPNNDETSTDPTFQEFKFNEEYTIDIDKQMLGYLSFPVEAKTYLVFQISRQLGIYGFQFTEGDNTNGVETITANKVWNADAPMYNLAGQKVDKSYKGIVIQNGRKFYNK